MSSDHREFPPRPLIPVAAGSVLGFSLAVVKILTESAQMLLAGEDVSFSSAVIASIGGATLMTGGLGGRARRSWCRWLAAVGVGVVLGSFVSVVWVSSLSQEYHAFRGYSVSRLRFCVLDDPIISDGTYSYHADAYDGDLRVGSVRLTMDRNVSSGSVLTVVGRLSAFKDDDWGRSHLFKGEARRVSVVKILRCDEGSRSWLERLRDRLISQLLEYDEDAGSLVAGIVCGRSSELKSGAAASWFSNTGTSHLIAVSGSHLALVCFLVEDVAERMGASRRVRLGAMLCVGVFYTLFTGASASAVRACCMVASGLFVQLFGRRRHGISALCCTMLALGLLDPAIMFDLGFQLSCASVLAIMLFAPYACYAFATLGVPDCISSPMGLTLCAQLATVPLTVPVFGSVSIVAPFANMVIGPIVSALLAFGVIFTPVASFVPLLGPLLGIPIAAARCALFFEQLFSSIPYASVPLVLSGPLLFAPWVLFAALYVLWPRPHPSGIFLVLLLAVTGFTVPIVYWDRFAPPSVTVLDVGQADAILIRQGSATLLVDSGVDERVVDALARQNVHHLDAVLITHWDEDHWGGLPSVMDSFPVGRLLVANGAAASEPDELAESRIAVEELSHGDVVSVGSFSGRVVWPRAAVSGLENDESLCLTLAYRDGTRSFSMLLTGDSEVDQEHAYAAEVGDVDVLKVGHHGSKVSVDRELLDEIDPEVCIASAGEGNRYGHPSKECRKFVREHGSVFLCTIDAGDIVLEPGELGPRIGVQKGTLPSSS